MLRAICNYSTPLARDIVKAMLAAHRDIGLPTQDLFKSALQRFPHAAQPAPAINSMLQVRKESRAEPQHPIRSVRYLKHVVLADMVERGEVEKVRIVRGSSDKNGIRMDAITVKGGERVLKANVASSKQEEWRWRLVEKRLNNEHTLDDLPESKK